VGEPGGVRIGELSRRVDVSEQLLRAWERRYGMPRPSRSAGGYRLYSAADERRVQQMKELLANGLSAAEAARVVLDEAHPRSADTVAPDLPHEAETLRAALDGFDEPAAQATLDRLLTQLSPTTVMRDVLLPYLRELGERWEQGTASVAQEHFASNVLRGRLAGLALGWGAGMGLRAVLACPPYELHDIPLMMFGIALHRLGWRVTFLGSSTPMAELRQTVEVTGPELIVLSAVESSRFTDVGADLAELSRGYSVAMAGAGADGSLAQQIGARLLVGDPVTAAQRVAGQR
jgi:MerR family transcriptional regulator, light-induced transcriptional regulator